MMSEADLHSYPDLLYDASKNNGTSASIYGPYEKLILSDWGQSNIHHDIVKVFDEINFKQMTPIQKNSFLYLMKNYNVAMVGFSKGKSISYLASILSSIMNYNSNNKNNATIGPKAIILSNSLGSCTELENLSKKLISKAKSKSIKIVVCYSSISVQQTIADVCNGCDILITTPNSLQNLLNKLKIFSWSNLRHFVFDNIELLLENYEDQMLYFFKILTKLKENNIQIISASVKWTKDVDAFLNQLFVKWQYIFGSHLEAACYMKVGFNLVQLKDDKLSTISYYLENHIKCYRCVLITTKIDELDTISNYIQQNNFNFEVLLPGKVKSAQVFSLLNWNKPLGKKKIMICSDDQMFDFYIDNADTLIHFDIPDDKRTFSIRFSVFQSSNTMFEKKERHSYIFSSTYKDLMQLPKVVEVMKTFGNSEVDPILLTNVKNINESLESEKKYSFFCSSVERFGYCLRPTVCQNRHILFKELDEPASNIPKSGLAIVQILNVYDASHMSVKLLKTNSTKNLNDVQNWSNVEDFSDTINHKINMYYLNQDLRIHEKPNLGNVVAVELEIKVMEQTNTEYYRAVVIGFTDTNTMDPKVIVKLIDQGFVETLSKWKVFVLPDELKCLPTTTVDVFVTSVKPVDSDKSWCSLANNHVKKILKRAYDCGDTFIIKVKMSLRTTIWVKQLYRKFWHPTLKMYKIEEVLPNILFDNGYADKNSEHVKNLIELCNSANISLQIIESLKKNNGDNEIMLKYKLPQPQWAYLDQNDSLVTVEYIMTPKLFFVRNLKFDDRIHDLHTKIRHYISQKQVSKLKHVVEGGYGLAIYSNLEINEYRRIKITKILNDKIIEVFFVDFGEFQDIEHNSLFEIHPDLIIQLPFQAIECSLSGMNETLPVGDELDKLVDYIFDMIEDPLYLKVIDTIQTSKYTDGSHYEVLLYNYNITVNLELSINYSQHCDEVQISKLIHIIDNLDENVPIKNDEDACDILINMLEDEDENMNPTDRILKDKFLEDFGMAIFGQKSNPTLQKIVAVKSIEDVKNESSVTDEIAVEITSVGTTENKQTENIKHLESFEEIKLDDSVVLQKPKQKKHKLRLNQRIQICCLTCNTKTHSIIPECIWHQDENYIFLKFNVLQIDQFNINCTIDSVTFNAQFEDASYAFRVVLFGFILENNLTHKRSFEGFHIKAEKLYKTNHKWPRLFLCNKQHKNVKYDPDHLEIKTLEPIIAVFNNFKMTALGTPLNVNDTDNDTDSNSSCDYDNFEDDLDF